MSKSIPQVERYMTPAPFTIGVEQTLAQAQRLMHAHNIRHLPVLHGGKLMGILSDRDIHIVETLRDVDPGRVTVEEAMSPAVYTVGPRSPLDKVATTMAEHKYGSALVVDQGKVVGVFTVTDALRALADALSAQNAS